MQLHELRPKNKIKKGRRVGRGGKRGTYSGRGMKGQRSRTGRRLPPAIRGWFKKYPKLRGYKFRSLSHGQAGKVINLDVLEKKFNSGEVVSPQILLDKKIIRRIKGERPQVKILGDGKITKPLVIENCLVSKQAKEKIEKANGQIK